MRQQTMLTHHKCITSALMVTLLILTSSLSGCGFQLRGQQSHSLALSELSISSESEDITINYLQQRLQRAGVSISDGFSTTLHLSDFDVNKRTIAYDSRGKTARLELTKSLLIRVTGHNKKLLLPETTLSTRQTYDYVETLVSGKDEERALLEKEMSATLADMIIRRLSALDTRKSSTSP